VLVSFKDRRRRRRRREDREGVFEASYIIKNKLKKYLLILYIYNIKYKYLIIYLK
jgi:hypothetical protein